jgi:putative permease
MGSNAPVSISSFSIKAGQLALFKALAYFGLLILFFWSAFQFLPYLYNVIFMAVVASLLASIISPVVDRLESRGIKRSLGTLIVFGSFFLAFGFFLVGIVPNVLNEATKLYDIFQSKSGSSEINALIDSLNASIGKFFPDAKIDPNIVSKFASSFFGQLKNILAGTVDAIAKFIFTLIITLFFVIDGDRIIKSTLALVPNQYFEMALNVSYKMQVNLSNFVRGQMMAAGAIALESLIGLYFLNIVFDANISNPFLIAGIAGMANIIPYVGPVMGMTPAIIISVYNNLGDPIAAANYYYIGHIIAMFIGVQVIDNNVVSPLVMSSSMNMHPLSVMLVILVGSQWGILGMLLAVPTWGVVKVIVNEVLEGLRRHHFV